jgi:hypothetical protein
MEFPAIEPLAGLNEQFANLPDKQLSVKRR